jgi:DNA-binding transcriptional ArsR family regulator
MSVVRRCLSPFDLSVYQIGSRFAWDPERIYDELADRKHRCDSLPLDRAAGIEHVTASIASVRKAVTLALREKNAVHEPRRSGKLLRVPEAKTPERAEVSHMSDAEQAPRRSFADRVREDAEREAARVLEDLERLRFDAEAVVRVMRALGIPVPALLAAVTETDAPEVPESVDQAEAAPEAPEEKKQEDTKVPETPDLSQRKPPPVPSGTSVGAQKASETGDENRSRVLSVIRSGGSTGLGLRSVYEKADLSQGTASRHIRALMDDGLVEKRGQARAARYFATETDAPGQQEPESAERAPAEDAQVVDPVALAAVRDFVTKQKKPFKVGDVVQGTSLIRPHVNDALSLLERRQVIENIGLDGFDLFEYRKPRDPGAAAKIDAESRKTGAAEGGSVPVPGTGRAPRAGTPEIDKLLIKVRRAGGSVRHAASGHFSIEYAGRSVQIPATPGSSAAVRTAIARVRQLGLEV